MGVGIGEAGGVAPSYALIADYFEPRRRARALAIFSLGVPVGLSLALVMGAYIAHAFSWRVVFFTMGVAGLILAPIMLLVVRDPPRTPSSDAAPIGEVFPMLARKPVFWMMAFAASFSSFSRPTSNVRGIGKPIRLDESFSTAGVGSRIGVGGAVASDKGAGLFNWRTVTAKRYPRRGIVLIIC